MSIKKPKTQIVLDEGTDAVVVRCGIRVEFNAGGGVDVFGNIPVTLHQPANDSVRRNAKDKVAVQDASADPEIGTLVPGKGIYAGTWTPTDRDGVSLGKTFNLFAAPKDIGVLRTFNNAVAHVAGLKNRHGHNGFNHDVSGRTPDEVLYDALRDGSYNGEWFIPTKDALNDNLFYNKNKFKPENAFITTSNGSDDAHWCWSCTEPAYHSSGAWAWGQRFTDGVVGWILKDNDKLSVRCVRAELRP